MIPQETPQPTMQRQQPVWKRILFRGLAVLTGLCLFPLIEASCYLLDVGHEDVDSDPFVGFTEIRPLFVPESKGQPIEGAGSSTVFETSRTRLGFFAPQSFQMPKPPGEFRIFVFGGSTVQGNPYQPETSFTTFLEQALTTASKEHDWKVINCGGISYASYRLLPIMQECTDYEPDLFIFCEGHNEFLEEITYADIKSTSPHVADWYQRLNQFRSFRVLDRAIRTPDDQPVQPLSDNRPVIPLEVDALLDHQGGLEKYHRDDSHAAAVVEHFRLNLERAIRMSHSKRIPLLMLVPPTNLRDCPPFKAECSDELSEESRTELAAQLDLAAKHMMSAPEESIEHLRNALRIDPRFAFTWYHLGHASLAVHRIEDAKTAFIRARDEDVCPLRMTSPLENALQDVVVRHSCPMINLSELLAENSRDGISGDDVLVDHIHPSFESHQQIAIRIVEWMQQSKLVRPSTPDWEKKSLSVFRSHMDQLDSVYFLRGQRALRDLQGWAAGRARKPIVNRENRPSAASEPETSSK